MYGKIQTDYIVWGALANYICGLAVALNRLRYPGRPRQKDGLTMKVMAQLKDCALTPP